MRIERYPDTEEARAAALRFNERLRACGVTEYQLGQNPFSQRYPEHPDAHIWQQYFLALDSQKDGSLEARGGYLMQYQLYGSGEGVNPHGFLRIPISEGIANKAYTAIGLHLVRDAMKRETRLCALGMGGIKQPMPRMIAALGWIMHEVPFHFRVLHPLRFFREARILRRGRAKTLACDLLAWSGIGWLGTRIVQWRSVTASLPSGYRVTLEPDFDSWADQVWEGSAPHYRLAGARSSHLLRTLYPVEDTRWIRVVVWKDQTPVGWALLLCTDCKGHKQFGNLRLGSIADCLSAPEHAQAVVTAATAELKRRKADLLVSNQTHQAWNEALRQCGYVKGPTNFVFAVSPALAKTLFVDGNKFNEIHMNRGDGDGPINL